MYLPSLDGGLFKRTVRCGNEDVNDLLHRVIVVVVHHNNPLRPAASYAFLLLSLWQRLNGVLCKPHASLPEDDSGITGKSGDFLGQSALHLVTPSTHQKRRFLRVAERIMMCCKKVFP